MVGMTTRSHAQAGPIVYCQYPRCNYVYSYFIGFISTTKNNDGAMKRRIYREKYKCKHDKTCMNESW